VFEQITDLLRRRRKLPQNTQINTEFSTRHGWLNGG